MIKLFNKKLAIFQFYWHIYVSKEVGQAVLVIAYNYLGAFWSVALRIIGKN